MSSRIAGLFRASRPARGLRRQTRRFRRGEDGATAVEFAFVIIPFLAILFAIIEVALVFFAGQVLETAVADSTRRIMTGEVQKAGVGQTAAVTQQAFKNDLCGRLYALFNCQSGVHIDVRKYDSFVGVNLSAPAYDIKTETIDVSGFKFEPGVQNEIVVVRVAYEWPIFVRDFGFNLATLPNGKRLLMATAAFRNEPYKN
jgi:Flp pilus assembly protein TadG